jgi:hypothetical protein
MNNLPPTTALLLDLLGDKAHIEPAALTTLSPADWEHIDRMVRQQRLGPLLHWQLTHTRPELPVPEEVRAGWAAAFERSSLRVLQFSRDLKLIHRLLESARIPYQTLKGAFLALHAYPHPALRPVRDIDILVPSEHILRAYDVLIAGGFPRHPDYPGSPEAQLKIGKHLLPLTNASGAGCVELHARLSHPGVVDFDITAQPDFWSRTIRLGMAGDDLAFTSPTDMLLHLIVHAAHDHTFNNGPLILSDIAFMLRSQTIDWPLFWRLAENWGQARAAALTLAITRRYWDLDDSDWPATLQSTPIPESVQLTAAGLMLAEPETSFLLKFRHELADQGNPAHALWILIRRFFPERARIAMTFPVREDSPLIGLYYLRYAASRLFNRMPQVLDQARRHETTAATPDVGLLKQWLRG